MERNHCDLWRNLVNNRKSRKFSSTPFVLTNRTALVNKQPTCRSRLTLQLVQRRKLLAGTREAIHGLHTGQRARVSFSPRSKGVSLFFHRARNRLFRLRRELARLAASHRCGKCHETSLPSTNHPKDAHLRLIRLPVVHRPRIAPTKPRLRFTGVACVARVA